MSGEIVSRLAARGDGVTENGRYVPMAAPGDRVGADGALEPGPHRIAPPCRHFPDCGGCRLQHVDEEAFAAFLVDRIASALAAQGIDPPLLRAPHLSPPRTRRRATLHVWRDRRGRQVAIGFHAAASHRIVDLRECHILRPELFALVAPLRKLVFQLLPPGARAKIQLTCCDQGADVLLAGLALEDLAAIEAAGDFARAHGLARLATDDGYGPQDHWAPEPSTITLSGVSVPLPHAAFLQATRDGEEALVSAVREAVGEGRAVADLFAGLGTFAFALPAKVHAVEGARDQFATLEFAARRAGRPVTAEHRDLFRSPLDAAELARFDAAVIDPPRAGAQAQVSELARTKLARLAYVSCNPPTFARDARTLLDAGWRLDWIQPVGQFRWSTHVELAACFTR